MSVLEIARIKCQAGAGDEFAERLKAGLTVQGEDPNCLETYVQRRVEDRDEFLVNLVWTSVEAHNAWREVGRERWRAHISDLLDGTPELLGHFEYLGHVKRPGA